MIVVADTTPVNYLVLIDAADLLPRLFGQVRIPPAVFAELQDPETPDPVRAWVRMLHRGSKYKPCLLLPIPNLTTLTLVSGKLSLWLRN